jgi:hypothetical protein
MYIRGKETTLMKSSSTYVFSFQIPISVHHFLNFHCIMIDLKLYVEFPSDFLWPLEVLTRADIWTKQNSVHSLGTPPCTFCYHTFKTEMYTFRREKGQLVTFRKKSR